MSLNLSVEDVPWAILEMVKARILAQRQRKDQPQIRPSLRPRPQFRRFGASSNTWRRPHPAAVASDDKSYIVGHLWSFTDSQPVFNSGVTAGIKNLPGQSNVRAATRESLQIGFQRTTALYCGNGSNHIEIEHGQPNLQLIPLFTGFPNTDPPSTVQANVSFQNYDEARTMILPAGGDRFLIFFFAVNRYASINTAIEVLGDSFYPGTDYEWVTCSQPPAGPSVTISPGYAERELSSFTALTDQSIVKRCFICSNTNIREISFPFSMTSLVDQLLTAPTNETIKCMTSFVSIGISLVRQIVATTTWPVSLVNWEYGNAGFYELLADNTCTPAVFNSCVATLASSLTEWQQRIGSSVKAMPFDLQWLIEDTSAGIYSPATWGSLAELTDKFNSSFPFCYGSWNAEYEEPTYIDSNGNYSYDPALFTQQSEATHNMSINRPSLTASATMTDASLYTVWDWADPDYCYALCKALGFTDADLTP